MIRFLAVSACCLALFARPARAADLVRPAQHASHTLASVIDTVRMEGAEFAGQTYLKSLAPDLREKLDKDGQVLLGDEKADTGSYAGYIRAVAIFHQPKKRVFELMIQPVTQALFMPHVESATAMARPANGELTEFVLKIMLSSFKFHVMHWFYPEQSRVEWLLDTSQKNDIKGQEGYWQLFELNATTTIAEYGTRIDTGIAVPKWIANIFARSDIPNALTAFRKYMDTNGAFRK